MMLQGFLREAWIWRALLAGIALSPSVHAVDATPLALSNQAVLARMYGVPAPQPARLLAPATSQWLLTSTLANTFSKGSTSQEAIFLDGESEELRLQWRQGLQLGDRALELFASLPWVHHGGGFLDRSIVEFHDFFGMPQGNRTRFENNQLRYAYRDGNRLLLEFEHSGAAIGDLQLGVGTSLWQSTDSALSVRAYVKLPTGDASQLSGSEATDVSTALHYATSLWGGGFDGAAGVVALGEGEVLEGKQRDYAAFGHVAWSYPWSQALDLVVQVGANSSFYRDTDLTELGDAAYLGVGTRYRAAPQWAVEFGIIEDILVNSTPDVGFQLALRFSAQ
jgi:hypothetical protein